MQEERDTPIAVVVVGPSLRRRRLRSRRRHRSRAT